MSSKMSMLGIDIGGTSAKLAWRDATGRWILESSTPYATPDRAGLVGSIRTVIDKIGGETPTHVGLCLPGKMNLDKTEIECSVNLPVLNGWRLDTLLDSIGIANTASCRVCSDAHAAGFDWVSENGASTQDAPIHSDVRTAALSLGTGVGLALFDGHLLARVGSRSTGHIGQLDVGRCGEADRYDPLGARNTLETYIGARSLDVHRKYTVLDLSGLIDEDPPIRALIKALRTVHAFYVPERIVLLGGVGLALRPLEKLLYDSVNKELTNLANPGWVLVFGDSLHHAARGAAKLALEDP